MIRETPNGRRGESDVFELDNPDTACESQVDNPGVENNTTVNNPLPNASNLIPAPVVTRYGRQVKPPIRFPDRDI